MVDASMAGAPTVDAPMDARTGDAPTADARASSHLRPPRVTPYPPPPEPSPALTVFRTVRRSFGRGVRRSSLMNLYVVGCGNVRRSVCSIGSERGVARSAARIGDGAVGGGSRGAGRTDHQRRHGRRERHDRPEAHSSHRRHTAESNLIERAAKPRSRPRVSAAGGASTASVLPGGHQPHQCCPGGINAIGTSVLTQPPLGVGKWPEPRNMFAMQFATFELARSFEATEAPQTAPL
jgi:hypothetical protein